MGKSVGLCSTSLHCCGVTATRMKGLLKQCLKAALWQLALASLRTPLQSLVIHELAHVFERDCDEYHRYMHIAAQDYG